MASLRMGTAATAAAWLPLNGDLLAEFKAGQHNLAAQRVSGKQQPRQVTPLSLARSPRFWRLSGEATPDLVGHRGDQRDPWERPAGDAAEPLVGENRCTGGVAEKPLPFGPDPDRLDEGLHIEIPTKMNWHYLRWVFDTERRRNTELQVNDLVLDLRELPVPVYDHSYWGCERLLNFCVDVRTHAEVRNFLWLDSVVVSVDW